MIDIQSYIPHRFPFLFVDEILSLSETEIVAKKTFSLDDDSFYQGHYPSNPITPGVIICESVFQTAAVLLSVNNTASKQSIDSNNQNTIQKEKTKQLDNINSTSENIYTKLVPVLSKIENARFKSIVRPGEEILISAKIVEQIGKFSILSGIVKKTDNTVVLRINFTLGYIEQEI